MNVSKPHLLHLSLSSQTDLQRIHGQSIRNINDEQIMDLLMKYFKKGKALYYQVMTGIIIKIGFCISSVYVCIKSLEQL